MKPAKSLNTLANQQQQPQPKQNNGNSAPTSPICRCRVMYLGSSVPHITKDGLQGIQEPLNELYPDKASLDQGNAGIDSWLSVWSNGILIENVDETGREVKRFFKIEALHYCAAVKFVSQMDANQSNCLASLPKFLPLDSSHARLDQNNTHPPIFASILRRTTGVKVLECHAFICKREAAANALVRCCFHAYADTMYAKQIGAEIDQIGSPTNPLNGPAARQNGTTPAIAARRSKSIAALNETANDTSGEFSDSSNQHHQQQQYSSSVSRKKSLNEGSYNQQNGELSDESLSHQHQAIYGINQKGLQKEQNFSKSMHHLNQPELAYGSRYDDFNGSLNSNQSTSYHNLSSKHKPNVPEPLFNPYASRIPSYPPQNIIDQQQQQQSAGTGTLRSVKSVAANSIASTLLRSKKHAKAMSMAQLSQSNAQLNQRLNQDRVTSFHQPHNLYHQQMATVGPGSFMTLPPVPPMFLPNIQAHLPQMNGSQTMKLPGRHTQQVMGPLGPVNFEAMTPKEIKKLLKKSAKYKIDPSRLTENVAPMMPLRHLPVPMHMPPSPAMMPPTHLPPPPPNNKSGTLGSQSLYSMDMHHDMPDYSSQTLAYGASGLGLPPPPAPLDAQGPMQPIKSILVKPNPEFLKSKAGKKWLKQQKEFKKLLPPHLDGLPIVFGPPPLDALEPADGQPANGTLQPPVQFLQPLPPPLASSIGLPMMDANGYYNPHPFYGPSGRASAASTLLRYSPHSQIMQQQQQQHLHENGLINGNQEQIDYMQRHSQHSQAMYTDPSLLINQQQRGKLPNGADPIYSSQIGSFDRHLQPMAGGRTPRSRHHHQRRNHMVEQSVISLGDENEPDDEGLHEIKRDEGDEEENEGQLDGYYDRVGSTSSHSISQQQRSRRHQQATSDYEEAEPAHHHQKQQQQQPQGNDDHSSHSSGIYRRKHINERAFSYSIRQEHMLNGGGNTSNSDADYVTDNGGDYSDSQDQNYHHHRPAYDGNNNNSNYHTHQRTYDNPQQQMQPTIYQNRSQLHYARNPLQQQHQAPPPPPPQVDADLSARLEQLNMKSFVNSGVKSHV